MKRIKILFVLVIVCLCSGCTINYDLEIKDKEIIENIMVTDTKIGSRDDNGILSDYNTWMPVYDNVQDDGLITDGDSGKIDGIEYHEKSINRINNGYYHTYKYTYPIDKFNHANSLRLAFGKPNFYDGGSYINLRTNSENVLCNYDYFESMQVNIKVDLSVYSVEQSNADRVRGNTYTWNLNRNNCNDGGISLTLNKISNTSVSTTATSRSNNRDRNSGGLDNYVLYIFLGIMVLVIIFGYRWFNKIKDRGNMMDD